MTFYSLTNPSIQVNFETALIEGLASDGGLFYPSFIPIFSSVEIRQLIGLTLPEIGFLVLQKWFSDDIEATDLRKIAFNSLNFNIPLVSVGNKYILEIFHGPTMAFKDVAARVLANLTSHFAQKQNKKIRILVATSGDTGGAVAHGFANVPNIEVYVLFPKGKVSKLQEKQLTSVADNIFPVEVDGFFDDCQTMVKQAFKDPDLKNLNLTSANSINIGRLIPQIIYHFWVWSQLPDKKLQIVIPSGNFGNLAAGLFAMKMGMPVTDFVAGVNANDTVFRFLQTGKYEPKPTISTLSNAMDISNPSNFVRILKMFENNLELLKKHLQVSTVSDRETIDTIIRVYEKHNYLMCPHTAVGWKAAEAYENSDYVQVIYGTASPVKFAHEIYNATKIFVDDTQIIQQLESTPARKIQIKAEYSELKKILA